MRHGFIAVHLVPGRKFDFQRYIKRSLEDDFKIVVGISPLLWASAVLFLLLNVDGWKVMYWLSLMPLVTILAVGMKLQAIITQMAVEIQEKHAVVQGIPLVQVSDKHFWLAKPHFILDISSYISSISLSFRMPLRSHTSFGSRIMVQVVYSYITLQPGSVVPLSVGSATQEEKERRLEEMFESDVDNAFNEKYDPKEELPEQGATALAGKKTLDSHRFHS